MSYHLTGTAVKDESVLVEWRRCGVQASKEVGRPIVHEFSREALAEAGATHAVPPFSIVSSNTMDLSVGRYVLYTVTAPHCMHSSLVLALEY